MRFPLGKDSFPLAVPTRAPSPSREDTNVQEQGGSRNSNSLSRNPCFEKGLLSRSLPKQHNRPIVPRVGWQRLLLLLGIVPAFGWKGAAENHPKSLQKICFVQIYTLHKRARAPTQPAHFYFLFVFFIVKVTMQLSVLLC